MDYKSVLRDTKYILDNLIPILKDMKFIESILVRKPKTKIETIISGLEKERDVIQVQANKVSIAAKNLQLKIWQYQFQYNWASKEYEVREFYLKVW